jgi:magnesium-transporting ATPase (P-type)
MNKTAAFKITGMMIALITAFGLFFGLIGYAMYEMGGQYDTTGYDKNDIIKYDYLTDLNSDLNESANIIESVRVNSNVFDWFAGIWNKLITPFKLIYTSYGNIISASDDLVTDLHLPPIYRAWFNALIIILVVIGIVMIKFYLGRNK